MRSGLLRERLLGEHELKGGRALLRAPGKEVQETLAGVQGTARPTEPIRFKEDFASTN